MSEYDPYNELDDANDRDSDLRRLLEGDDETLFATIERRSTERKHLGRTSSTANTQSNIAPEYAEALENGDDEGRRPRSRRRGMARGLQEGIAPRRDRTLEQRETDPDLKTGFGGPMQLASQGDPKPKKPNVGVVTAGPVKPVGLPLDEIARLATSGPLSTRINASTQIGRNPELARAVQRDVRKRTAPNLPEAVADVALSQLPVILGSGGSKAADEAAEHAMERYAEGGGDPGQHANLFGAAGALGALGSVLGTGGSIASPKNGLPLLGRSIRAAKHGAALGGTTGAVGGATFGTDTKPPGLEAALEEGATQALGGALLGPAVEAAPELGAKAVRKGVDFVKGLELSNRSGSLGTGKKVGDPFSRSRVMGTKVRTPEGEETTITGDLPVTHEVPVVTPKTLAEENLGRVAQTLAKRADTHGGFTFDPHTGKFVSKGYAVALGKVGGKQVVTKELTPEALQQFLTDNGDFFRSNPNVRVGAWKNAETGDIYLEPSEVLPDRKAAVALGLERGELAVGDLGKYSRGEDGDIPLELQRFEHRSPVAGLTTLSGKFQGTNPGVTGAERARAKRTGRVYVQDVGSELEPEFRRGDLNLYHAEVPKGQLYDVNADPDGIVRKVGGRNVDQWEKAIEKAGYAGYYASEGGYPHYKTLFGDTPVVGAGSETPVRPISAPRPTSQPRPANVPVRTVEEVQQLVVKGRKSLEKAGYGAQIKEAVKRGLTDVIDAISKVPHAREWYKADLGRMDTAVREMIPETSDPTRMQLFRAVLAITSNGQKPVNNFKSAVAIFNKFLEAGGDLNELSLFRGGKGVRARTPNGGMSYRGPLDESIPIRGDRASVWEHHLTKLREFLGPNQDEWGQKLERLWAERRQLRHRQIGTGESVEFSQPLAADIFGRKIGRFYANLSGSAEDVTVDVWAARTLRRWLGYAPAREGAPSEVEGNVMRAAVAQLAQQASAKTGQRFDPMDIQALLWYYEKQRFADLGARDSGQISYADAAEFIRQQRAAAPAGHPGLGEAPPRAAGREGDLALGGGAPGALTGAAAVGPDLGPGPRGLPNELAGEPLGGAPGHRAGDRGVYPAPGSAAEAEAEARGIGYETRGLDLNAARLQNLIDLQQGADLGPLSRLFSGLPERIEPAAVKHLQEIDRTLETGLLPNGQPVSAARLQQLYQERASTREFLEGRGAQPRLKNRGGYLDLSGRKPEPNERPSEPESIEGPAIRTRDGRIFRAPLHIEALEQARDAGAVDAETFNRALRGEQQPPVEDGFITSSGRFVDRREAGKIAGFGDDYDLDATDGTPLDKIEADAQWAENVKKSKPRRLKNRPGFVNVGSSNIEDVRPPLDAVQEIFGKQIAGSHSVLHHFEDGSILSSARMELNGKPVRFYFVSPDEELSDFDLVSPQEAYEILGYKPGEPKGKRLKNRPGFLNVGGSPRLPNKTEGTGTPYKAKVDVTEDERALANIAKLNLSPESEAKVRDAYQRLDLSKKTVSHEETRQVANELGLDPNRLLAKEGRLSGAELLAVRDVVSSNAKRIVELSKEAQNGSLGASEKQSLLDQVAHLTEQNDEYLRRYTKQREQAGRDLNALRIIARNSLDAPTWLLQGERLKGLPLTQEEHVRISQLASDSDRDGLIRYVAGLRKSSPLDKAITLWKAGLLTSLGTHLANVSGNAAMAVTESAKDIPAALVDAVISLARGTERTKAPSFRGLVVEPVKGFVGPGFKAARRVLRYGAEPSELAKWDFRKTNFGDSPAGRVAQAYTDAVFNSLGAEDQLFRSAAVGRSLEEQARLAAKGNKTLLAQLRKQPTPQMMVQAIADAEVATFQNPNLAAKGVSSLRQGLRAQGKAGETASAATEFVAPFVRTPSNITARTIEMSPAGLAYNSAKLAKALVKGIDAPDQKQLAEAIGRGIVGSSTFFLLGFMLAREGKATGSMPKSATERAQYDLEGKTQNAVNVNGTWRSFARLGPPGLLIATGAQAYEAFRDNETAAGKVAGAVYAPVRASLDQSFLQGPSQALDALNDPNRAMERFAESTAGSVIPAGVAQVARATDPLARETHGIGATLQSRIPGLRNQLPARLNAFGKPIEEGTLLSDLFDPTRPRKASTDPLIQALTANGISVGFPSKTVTAADKSRRKLTDDEYRATVREVGNDTERALRDLYELGLFKDAGVSPDERKDLVESKVTKVRGAANRRRRQREAEQQTVTRKR